MFFDVLVKKINHFLQKHKIYEVDNFMFLAISLAIFELKRCTIPHFNPINKLIWPLEMQICSRVDTFWAMTQNVCLLFFPQTLAYAMLSDMKALAYKQLFWLK